MKLNGLEKYFKTVNGEIIDLRQVDSYGRLPLMRALNSNKSANLNLNKDQWDYLIKNSDLKETDQWRSSSLMYALRYNQEQNLNLSIEQFSYLIKNSDLKKLANGNVSPLNFALIYNKKNNLNLSNNNWKYLIDNSDLSLIKEEEQLIELKKIQSELLNAEILYKINIQENNKKVNKI